MKWLLSCVFCLGAMQVQAADVRFDAHYFFQPERALIKKNIEFKELSRYSNAVQLQVYKTLKKTKLPESNGYLVLAVRSDGEVASWLDMAPALDAAAAAQIAEAVKKVTPVNVAQGILVFALKMSVDTPSHTQKPKPAPPGWKGASLPTDADIEQVVLSVWPQ